MHYREEEEETGLLEEEATGLLENDGNNETTLLVQDATE